MVHNMADLSTHTRINYSLYFMFICIEVIHLLFNIYLLNMVWLILNNPSTLIEATLSKTVFGNGPALPVIHRL